MLLLWKIGIYGECLLAKDQGPRGECEETSMRCVGWKMK
jgi:hypothetical protein